MKLSSNDISTMAMSMQKLTVAKCIRAHTPTAAMTPNNMQPPIHKRDQIAQSTLLF